MSALHVRTPENCPQRHTHSPGRACPWCDFARERSGPTEQGTPDLGTTEPKAKD